MAQSFLELANIVIARGEVLFSKTMEQTIFENSFVDTVWFVKDLFALAILTICEIVSRVTLILSVMLTIPL